MFLGIIITFLVLALLAAFLIIFSPWLKGELYYIPEEGVYSREAMIDLSIADSEKIKELEPFPAVKSEFSYIITDKDGKQIQGKMSAINKEEAKIALEKEGFKVLLLQELFIGKKEPFAPYYPKSDANY